MNLATIPTLDELAENPERAVTLPPAVLQKLLFRTVYLFNALMVATGTVKNDGSTEHTLHDHLIPLSEAGKLLDRSRYWFYEHRAELPFIVGTGRSMKCSYNGVMEFIRDRKGA